MIVLTFAERNVDETGSENDRKRLVIGWRSPGRWFLLADRRVNQKVLNTTDRKLLKSLGSSYLILYVYRL